MHAGYGYAGYAVAHPTPEQQLAEASRERSPPHPLPPHSRARAGPWEWRRAHCGGCGQAMAEKQRRLQEVTDRNRRLQTKMEAVRAQRDAVRSQREQALRAVAARLEQRAPPDPQAAKLDAILAQSLQMQTLLLAQARIPVPVLPRRRPLLL
jgi:hypothetical protein